MEGSRFSSLTLQIEETDLWIGWKGGVFPSAQGEGESAHPTEIAEKDPVSWMGGGAAAETGGTFLAHPFEEHRVRQRATHIVQALRRHIQEYSDTHPNFLSSLVPLHFDPEAPPIVQRMLQAGQAAGVGPMAAVAGAIAAILGEDLTKEFAFDELVIENGGDYWLWIQEPLLVGVYAGLSSLSGKIAVRLQPSGRPWGLACSSGTVGPSLSFGKADAAMVLAPDAAAADAWATALGNLLKRQEDMEEALSYLASMAPQKNQPQKNQRDDKEPLSHFERPSSAAPQTQKKGDIHGGPPSFCTPGGTSSLLLETPFDCLPQGALCIMADHLAAWGNLELVPWDGSWTD
ncbi:UPF0280 family protein [Treponema sp. J25]|uniref:UPF0280 family protein n=1 Tax=Treponema sp. J25 TaxID=2094121 RepID=UPI001052C1CD|nr:UPF0280 family protein [Treponema sp. J25]TCW60753.1 hypothetical protein C5O22_09800 [Treponema sp. J25]